MGPEKGVEYRRIHASWNMWLNAKIDGGGRWSGVEWVGVVDAALFIAVYLPQWTI